MSEATTAGPLTVVLVHGAFADSSSWTGVIERLQAHGVPVFAAVNPLRGISIDSAYVASVFDQVPGPVLAVGHSYGGAVISNAASGASNVVGLVYVAAFAPDEGETLMDVEGRTRDSVLLSALRPNEYPAEDRSAVELSIDPASPSAISSTCGRSRRCRGRCRAKRAKRGCRYSPRPASSAQGAGSAQERDDPHGALACVVRGRRLGPVAGRCLRDGAVALEDIVLARSGQVLDAGERIALGVAATAEPGRQADVHARH